MLVTGHQPWDECGHHAKARATGSTDTALVSTWLVMGRGVIATSSVLGVVLMHVVLGIHRVMMRRPTRQPRHRRHALNRERQNAKPDEEDLE